jgi:hypothetical protein
MYPSHVVEGLGPLAHYLVAPPGSGEIALEGGLSNPALGQIEGMLLHEVERRIVDFDLPENHPRGVDPDHRWRTVSSMQKAIRYRDRKNAIYAACTGWDMSPAHVLRRLGVIALEDVGAGNLLGVAMTLASLGSSTWRRSIGERRLTVWLADQLAQSPKDRTLCELCVLANYDTAPDKLAMSRWPDRQLVDCMDNRQAPLAHRMVAAWLLSGSHEFHAVTVLRQSSRHHRHLIRLMVDRGLPRVLLYLAHKAVSRLREDMFVSLPFMHEMLLRTSGTSFRQPTSIAAVMIGPLLAAAYDMHTREGLLALRLFAERVPPIQRYLDQVPADQRSRLMRSGVFLAEGARLASQLDYAGSIALANEAHRAELSSPGLPEERHRTFIAEICQNTDTLNAARCFILRR